MEEVFQWINSNGWIVSIGGIFFGAILSYFFTKNKEILMKIADKKSQHYADYINALLEFSRLTDYHTKAEINRRYMYFKNMVILYGSEEVIEKLAICEREGINYNSSKGQKRYIDLIQAMKKDVENPKIIKSWWRRFKQDKYIEDILFEYKKGDSN